MVDFQQYLKQRNAVRITSSCGLFSIVKTSNAFSIVENGGGSNKQRYDYYGLYTHSFVNKHLTRMRKPLLNLFMNSLSQVNVTGQDMQLTCIAWMKLTSELKEHFLTEYSVGKCNGKVVVKQGLVNNWT
jgi:hypothetical protein